MSDQLAVFVPDITPELITLKARYLIVRKEPIETLTDSFVIETTPVEWKVSYFLVYIVHEFPRLVCQLQPPKTNRYYSSLGSSIRLKNR